MRSIWSATLLASLYGCTATGPVFNESTGSTADKTIAYLYRPHQVTHSLGAPTILLDNKSIGTLLNGSYLALPIQPGKHSIVAPKNFLTWGMSCNVLNFEIQEGEKKFIKLTSWIGEPNILVIQNAPVNTGSYQCAITEIPQEQARQEISTLNQSN